MEPLTFHDGRVELYAEDCLAVLKLMPDCFVDAVITDPPYHLTSIVKRFASANPEAEAYAAKSHFGYMSRGFMGQQWDGGDIASRPDVWRECLRVLKPGGHLAAFGGTRTYHRMACAIEDAGFEIRDQLAWTYGSGFPKSHDVSKGIDRAAGVKRKVVGSKLGLPGYSTKANDTSEHGRRAYGQFTDAESECAITAPATDAAREWQGWGTALKPAWEPICLARKPLSEGTVAANVLRWGTGAINVDGCRVEGAPRNPGFVNPAEDGRPMMATSNAKLVGYESPAGRFPANLIHDGSPEVLAGFPDRDGAVSNSRTPKANAVYGEQNGMLKAAGHADSGSAARFFYCAKANKKDRAGSNHPTVKPISLIAWLVRMLTPPGGLVLDPFAGTGTLAAATFQEDKRAILIEREELYRADIVRRVEAFAA